MLAACRDAEVPPEPGPFHVADSAGVPVASSLSPEWAPGQGWTVSPEPSLVLGGGDAQPTGGLFRVRGVARLADGVVVLLDQGSRELRFYDAEGALRRVAGGEGEGPGELTEARALTRAPGDTLWVDDGGEIERFGPDGRHLGARRVELAAPTDPTRSAFVERVLPDGGLAVRRWHAGDEQPERPGLRRDSVEVYVAGAAGGGTASLGWWPTELLEAKRYEGSWTAFPLPMTPRLVMGVDGSDARPRVVLAVGDMARLGFYGVSGRLERVVRWSPALVGITPEAVERHWARVEGNIRSPSALERLAIRRTLSVPGTLPLVEQLVVDETGHVWVRSGAADWSDPATFTVFDPSGRWLGPVAFPGGLDDPRVGNGPVIGADWVLGVWKDERGVEEVRLYGLAR